MSFSIGTQSGNFSYQAFIRPQRDDHISFGFSFINTGDGSIEDRIVFSGESGKLYDSDNNFFYSYKNQDTFSVSGNKIGNYNNYFVNNVLINSYHENGTGYINNFTENGVVSELSLMGVEPVISISGIFENSNLTGSLKVSNNSSEGISFNIFSGKFEELSNFFNFNTGQNTGIIEGQSSRDFLINQISNVTTGTGVLIPISFVSDFGTFTKSGLISFTREYEYLLSLLGSDFLDSTGIFNYNVLFSERYGPNLTDDPFGLHFTFGNISGYGGYADYDIKTGKITGSIPGFDISRNIIGTGNLTGMIESSLGGGYLTLSGYSTGLEINYTGNIPSQIYTGETVFATGEMSYPFLTSSSGIVTGLDVGFIRNVSGGYNFTETGAIRFTGQQSLFPSFTTGIILSGNNTDGEPIVTSKNDSLCFSFDVQSFTATSNQTRNKEYASRFSGFATGAFDGIAYYPGDQAGLDITTTISGFKIIDSPGAFIGTGTGVFDLIGTFPMDTRDYLGNFVNNGWTIDLSDRILTGIATGLLPEDPGLTGSVLSGTGVTGTDYVEGTGVLTGSGIVTGILSDSAAGFTGIDFVYNYIAKASNLSGITTSTTNVITGRDQYLGGQNAIPDVLMTGEYEYRFDSIRLQNNFESQFIVGGEDTLSGRVDFTGEFQYSGTGAYVHPQEITGIGYTGLGLIGSISEPVKDIIFNGASGATGRYLTNTGALLDDSISLNGNSYGIPVSSVYRRFDPFIFSGNSGILLYSDHTNEKAPILSFSNNDAGRGSYIHNPVWLNRRLLSGTVNLDPSSMRVGISPKYFLSGTGVYKSQKSRNYRITVYTGNNFLDMIYKEGDGINLNSTTDFNERFTSSFISEYDPFNVYFLITSNSEDLEPSGFNYFYFQDTDNSKNPPEFGPRQFNTFFDSSGQGFRRFLTNYSSPTDASGYLLSADTIYPTGVTTNRVATSVPGALSYTSGFNRFQTGFKMTGFVENVTVQGTGMSGVGNIEGTGQVSGILHALQDRNLFPRSNVPNEIFTQMTGNFAGDKSVNSFDVNTGAFLSNTIYLLAKRVDNNQYQYVDQYSSSYYEEIERFRIPTYQSSIEEISGILKKRCDQVGYTLTQPFSRIGFTSFPQMTYPIGAALALGLNSSSHENSFSKDAKYVTRQSGGLYTLLENGLETTTQGTNLPYSGIMSGGVDFSFPSEFVTGTGFFEETLTGDIYTSGFTGIQTGPAKWYIDNLDFDGNIVDLDATVTGYVPTIASGTGIDPITILAGQQSGEFDQAILNMLPFSGVNLQTITFDQPVGGFEDSYADNFIYSGVRKGFNFATGILTGSFDYTGILNFTQRNLQKTGVKIGIGVISGNITGIVYPGSGEFNFSGIQTGLPQFINSVVPTGQEVFLLSSGNVPITPFTGNLNSSFIGTGFYTDFVNPADLESLSYSFPIPNYIKTFTGEYEILTGINNTGFAKCTGFFNIPSINLTGYSGYVVLTGDDDLNIQMVKKKYFADSVDLNIIKYSGIGTLDASYDNTGSLTFIG